MKVPAEGHEFCIDTGWRVAVAQDVSHICILSLSGIENAAALWMGFGSCPRTYSHAHSRPAVLEGSFERFMWCYWTNPC